MAEFDWIPNHEDRYEAHEFARGLSNAAAKREARRQGPTMTTIEVAIMLEKLAQELRARLGRRPSAPQTWGSAAWAAARIVEEHANELRKKAK